MFDILKFFCYTQEKIGTGKWTSLKNFLRFILFLTAIIILVNVAYLWLVSNTNLGLILATVLGVLLLFYALIFDGFNRLLETRFGGTIKTILFICFIGFAFIASLITMSGNMDTVTFQEEAVIVLGAGIHGKTPSKPLIKRLETTLRYHKLNPEAYIVVTGGQGAQETITEAEAMKRYLEMHGVNPKKIIKEEQATSTYENFLFSKAILDETLANGYKTAYITNSFHTYRAGRVAKSAGLTASRMHAENELLTLLPDYLRESCAVFLYWLTGK